MSDQQKQIHVCDEEKQILASFTLKEREKAFSYAAELEEMGISVLLIEPSLPETLIMSLGASQHEREELKKEIDEEIDSHGTECDKGCLK